MEFVLFEGALIAFAVFEILGAFAVEHAVVPIAFILAMPSFSVENTPSALHSVSKFSLVPAAIRPPERSPTVSFASLELSLINIAFFTSPSVNSSPLLFVKSELSYVVVSSGEVQLALTLKLSIMELSVNDFMSIFEEADSATMGPINFCFADVYNFCVFEEFRSVEGGLCGEDSRRAVLDNEQLLQLEFDGSEFLADEGCFVVEIIEIKLGLLQHFFLRTFVNL